LGQRRRRALVLDRPRAHDDMPTPRTTTEPLPTDGRLARTARTRAAIVDALLDLLEAGDLQPTASRIADRAGTSLRLIYHHFGDLESLFHAAAARQTERLAQHIEPIDTSLPLPDRVDAIVDQRSDVLEWITPVRLASQLQEPFSEELRSARDGLVNAGELQVEEVFAVELDALPVDDRAVTCAALGAALGWGMWHDLRSTGRSPDEARAVVHRTVAALVGLL
jgi:AcrR family transcriptional regulator